MHVRWTTLGNSCAPLPGRLSGAGRRGAGARGRRRASGGAPARGGLFDAQRPYAQARVRHGGRPARPCAGRRAGRCGDPERSGYGCPGDGGQDRLKERRRARQHRRRVGGAQGAPVPDISSAEALRRSLLAAGSVAHADPARGATAGTHFARVLERLGIAAEMAPRVTVLPFGGDVIKAVAEGRFEIGVSQSSEILDARGRGAGGAPAGPVRSPHPLRGGEGGRRGAGRGCVPGRPARCYGAGGAGGDRVHRAVT